LNYDEYTLFKLIKSVDGVGPKTAFGIVQSSKHNDIKSAILSKDVNFFERIKGIGKKTAQKILLELSSKMGAEFELSDVEESKDDVDALDALKALGYKTAQIKEVLRGLESTLTIEEKIRKALQKLN
jgi:Holliday junction DNA helicase RuvA